MEPFNRNFSQKGRIIAFVNCLLSATPNVELGISISLKVEKLLENEVVETFLNSAMSRVSFQLTDVEYLQHVDNLMTQFNVFATGGSGWVVRRLKRLEIKTVTCGKVTGGSYIETPPFLKPLNRLILNFVKNVITSASCIVLRLLYSSIGRANSSKIYKKNIERL